MKNIGFDVAKPDRHVNRALGSFELIEYNNWPDRMDHKAPVRTENEMVRVMQLMREIADEVGVSTSYLDNAIWLLCCKSGLYYTNQQLSALTG
jgi:thermostable 8-oxoguanine DNA glycosylase